MKRLVRFAAVAAVVALVAVVCTPAAWPAAAAKAEVKTGQYAQSFETPAMKGGVLKYLISVPEDYATKGPWPMILFLHGSGERGDNVETVKVHGPPKLIAAGRKVPAIVVSPQCPADTKWEDHLKALVALLDDIQRRYEVDPARIYLTGLSMGGSGAWILAADQPQRFAAVVICCGRKPKEPLKLAGLKDVPFRVYHGARDPTVPLKDSEDLVADLKAAGGQVQLTVYPDLEHDCWTRTYSDESLWKWLFDQRRATPAH